MATPQDADLIIKLYDLRRDETMRKARNYFAFEFFPKSVDDVKEVFTNVREHPEQNAYFRQVISYWEMAAAMVNHGSIDQALFLKPTASSSACGRRSATSLKICARPSARNFWSTWRS